MKTTIKYFILWGLFKLLGYDEFAYAWYRSAYKVRINHGTN